ncbi:WD repeat-containing protein 7 isoform X3 [Planococcus citri]|uniref:WD repeat-containing protein 7 isoform X3 n=1 Tax=Planococcus citri TaxID=170843 RepID=UPI0031F81534
MAAGTNLVVPVVLWGKNPPTHCISCIFLSDDQKTLVSGCYDGQICIWHVDPNTLKMVPRCLMVGHTAPILCLANGSIVMNNNYIVSSSENGEMCLWDLVDGKCREVTKLPYVHTNIQSYQMSGSEDVKLFCNGYYAEIFIMDPFSLEVICSLSSREKSDWISALYVLRPAKRKEDVVLGLTVQGTVKVWTLESLNEPIYENESKIIRCLNAISMVCCNQHQRTVIIVCSKYWQIYDAGDFSLLCSVAPPFRERWFGGKFLSQDRVLVWTDEGKGYMYYLPANKLIRRSLSKGCIPDNKDFHKKADAEDTPFLYCTLADANAEKQPLACPPAMRYYQSSTLGKILLRGDSEGAVKAWIVPDFSIEEIVSMKTKPNFKPDCIQPFISTSVTKAWKAIKPPPVGILDQLDVNDQPIIKLTASIYLPMQSRLVVGREDGSIIIIPATQTVMLQLLHGSHQQYVDWPPHQRLLGHVGRVNCLLYPNHIHDRYDKSHLLSGGIDFAVCLWDLYTGSLLHRFCVHAGEITQLLVPPNNTSARVQRCICSVASDHSVTLLSLSERKCVVLASRHLFPVVTIKWRPLDDFMIVGCSDGTVYVWQMETGHLDRVLHGIGAEEVLYACDETTSSSSTSESGLANPAVHFFRGLRSRNISAIRHATQRGIHQLQQLHHGKNQDENEHQRSRAFPLMIQGLRTNPKDPESHILCFDIEALIVQLLSEEYGAMSPGTLEAHGLINTTEYAKVVALTRSASPDAHKKIAGIISKVKEGAETVQTRIQAKAENLGFKTISSEKGSAASTVNEICRTKICEANLTMEIAQLLLSLLHAWGLDPDLDRLCEAKLGLLKPRIPVSFGVISKGGYMSLLLPTWQLCLEQKPVISEKDISADSNLSFEMVQMERLTQIFTAQTHWELSTTLTSNHLLTIIALANTLMTMNNASFVAEQERNRKLQRQSTKSGSWRPDEASEEIITTQQAHIKQGWSLLATLHCVLLPDKVVQNGSKSFKRPQIEMMARRWQHHCLEVRQAAQSLLMAELRRLGPKGRKALVDYWAQFLPVSEILETPAMHKHHSSISSQAGSPDNDMSPPASAPQPAIHDDDEEEEEDGIEELCLRKPSSATELRRKQTTAVVLLGVIGAEFGQEVGTNGTKSAPRRPEDRRKSSIVEGFGIGNNDLARLTSLALTNLLLAPASTKLPAHTSQRRAAVDLIGRGYTIWEPYLDVSKVLLGLLELCSDADKLVPSMTYGLPLTPAADSCRTARHALTQIASVRPAAFITTMAKEVARYNSIQQNQQSMNANLANNVLHRAKPEILRVVEMLITKMNAEVVDLLVEVMDIILHCVDPGHLKARGLSEVFPAICVFNQVSHCPTTRRIAVGAKSGTVALYELRSSKSQCQMINAHNASVNALAFSSDGKTLVSYSCGENRLCFWQTSTGMFGLGNSQTKCIKSYSTSPIAELSRSNPLKLAKLVWINTRQVSLMLADGSETRFNI